MDTASASLSRAYKPLGDYLQRRFADRIVLTFEQIESLLGFSLPEAARTTSAWWDPAAHPQCGSWVGASRTAIVNLSARSVLFERSEEPRARHSGG